MQGQDLLAVEVATCRELVGLEPDTAKRKWPLLTLARLYRLQAGQQQGQAAERLQAQAADLFRQLVELDPKRAGYYGDELAGSTRVVLGGA